MVDGYGAWSSFMDHDKISEDDFFERSKPLYKRLIENVVKQKERLGGTFAVAHAIPIRKTREYMSEIAGADLIFIVMIITEMFTKCNKFWYSCWYFLYIFISYKS